MSLAPVASSNRKLALLNVRRVIPASTMMVKARLLALTVLVERSTMRLPLPIATCVNLEPSTTVKAKRCVLPVQEANLVPMLKQ